VNELLGDLATWLLLLLLLRLLRLLRRRRRRRSAVCGKACALSQRLGLGALVRVCAIVRCAACQFSAARFSRWRERLTSIEKHVRDVLGVKGKEALKASFLFSCEGALVFAESPSH